MELACAGFVSASLSGSALGGRPRRGMRPALSGNRPASARARRNTNSICALLLRSSSAAQRARASWTAGSNLSRTLLRSVTGSPQNPSVIQRSGVDDRLGGVIAAQDDEQVGDHGGLAFLVQLHDVLLGE